MTIIDNETVVVYDAAELATAVNTDNGISYVYLGDDIALTAGVTIYAGKPSLTIDGLYDGVTHTFTDIYSTSEALTIGVRTASSIDLVFQNMAMIGSNPYGIPYVSDAASLGGVTVTYRNVTYTGPQMSFNANGLVRYLDCDITLEANPLTTAQELGEFNRLEIGGKTTIEKIPATWAILWFRGTASTPDFKILAGADVTITTPYYLMYSLTPVPCTIEPGASFTLNAYNGFCLDAAHRAASFLVDAGATFRLIQTGPNISMFVDGAFTVNEGASVYMQSDSTVAAYPLIYFYTTAASLSLNNPKSFVLYRKNYPAIYFGYSTPFSISGGQLNYWSAATAFPAAGTFADIPAYKWFRPDWSVFSLSGASTYLATTVTANDFTPEELANLPALTNLRLYNARVLSVGDLPLAVNTIVDDGRPVSGATEPGAEVLVAFTLEGVPYSFTGTADAEGGFSVDPAMTLPAGTVIEVSANTPFLITTVQETAQAAGELYIESAPGVIRFLMSPISQSPIILPREPPDVPVVVKDTRADRTQWELMASIAGPMESASGYTLPDAVILVDGGGDTITLSTAPVAIYTGGPGEETTEITWPNDEGVLLRITAPLYNHETYSAQMVWGLREINV